MADEKRFFLGLGGQQAGPYSEQEVHEKIRSGEAKGDSLIWYEGLSEWQRVDTIAYFQSAFKRSLGAVFEPAPRRKPAGDETPKPVFSPEEAVFFRPKGPRPEVLVAAGIAFLLMGVWYWQVNSGEETTKVEPQLSDKNSRVSRYSRFQKAESDYLLKPNLVPSEFLELVKENQSDEWGKKAAESLETILKKRKRNLELGELYALIGRYEDAIEAFVAEGAYPQAEQAAYKGFQGESDPKRQRALLLKSIEILTGPAQNMPLALTRIKALDVAFPNQPHPFGYYLLTPEKKIVDLFNRTSFFFVESLVHHLKAEFPQMKLDGRPKASLVKEGADRYRIVGTYKGDVVLSHDKLKDIRFEYWFVDADWNLVSTNVTSERSQWAKNNRARHVGTFLSQGAALSYLESMMHNQFPRLGLHEKISQEAMQSAARQTSSSR